VADSEWKTLITALHARLGVILEAEGKAVPTLVFGRSAWDENQTAPRMAWIHAGGDFNVTQPPLAPDADTQRPLMARVAVSMAKMWGVTDELVERYLDRLVLATRQMPEPARFMWSAASYEYPTQEVGKGMQNGVSVLTLKLPIALSVASVTDAQPGPVVVTGNEFRAGIENPAGEDIEESEYDVDRLTSAWPG
jgi:hypothetical protein